MWSDKFVDKFEAWANEWFPQLMLPFIGVVCIGAVLWVMFK